MRWLAWVIALTACGDNRAPKSDSSVANGACQAVAGTSVTMRLVTTATSPMAVVSPPNDPRLFIVLQPGKIVQLVNGSLQPFLDLSEDAGGPVVCCGEQGLLGLAFHPDFATNGLFYVFYTTATQNVLARYHATGDTADPASGTVLLAIDDFAVNHNGGMLEFGPDGYLYIGTGDGGGGGDPHLNGQNTFALLGKLLRIDVDHGTPYGIPPTNPFADGVAGAPEVFTVGTRNPWRWGFDRGTGDLWIGDVGQDQIEELDYLPAGTLPGANLGWSMYEASSCFHPPCDPAPITMPVYQREHADGWCAIIGGDVYRGACYPDLIGTYFFTDYCAHELIAGKDGAFGPVATRTIEGDRVIDGFPVTPSSLHADSSGELYLTTISCCGSSLQGGVYHLEAGP